MKKMLKRFSWIFSSTLLITLIGVTLFIAEGLQFDFATGTIERKGSIAINDLRQGKILVNGNEFGSTPNLISTVSTESLAIKVQKEGRIDWVKNISPKPGFVKAESPILYPKDFTFEASTIKSNKFFKNSHTSTFFMYEKATENGSIALHKYAISKPAFVVKVDDTAFSDITSVVKGKEYSFIPNTLGKAGLLVIPNDSLYVVNEGEAPQKINGVVPKSADQFQWSLEDDFVILKTGEELYSIDVSNNRIILVYRPQLPKEKVEVQYVTDTGITFKIETDEFSDLAQNSFEGNEFKKIELPNVKDGNELLRRKRIKKAYDFTEKHNIILIQTPENIYSYNILTFEVNKFNTFKNEEIIFTDILTERLLTINSSNFNQFRFYDLKTPDMSKTFTLNKESTDERPSQIMSFNNSLNIMLSYKNKVELLDIDGFNKHSMTNLNNPELLLSARVDNFVELLVKSKATDSDAIIVSYIRFEN